MEKIAIIGMGCRFPGANDPQSFWELLHQGVCAVDQVPPSRWDGNAFYSPYPATPGKMNTQWGGFLQGIEKFDSDFFNVSAREAEHTDPQQRLVLEVAWEALENAGIIPENLAGSQTGVFIGISSYDYHKYLSQDIAKLNAYSAVGTSNSIAANRLSYFLDIRGPSMAVDTACSSSLVAVHLACQSLQQQETDLCLVGGINLILTPDVTISFSQAKMISADGHCRAFDQEANGYVRGEGCGVVVLKRFADACKDGDKILGVIRGSAVNQDGLSNGITAPNGLAQEMVIRKALANSGVQPVEINYIEAHGTGTSLGDSIEISALFAVFKPRLQDQPLVVGSVKTNIGHLEAAAGIASLIKVILALQHEQIPPNLYFHQPNPYINWEEFPAVIIPTLPIAWSRGAKSRLAGLSCFGFGGTNAHLVIEETPLEIHTEIARERPLHLLTLSAKNEITLQELTQKYLDFISQDFISQDFISGNLAVSLADICFTANTGRTSFDYRLSIVAASNLQLREQLSAFIAQENIVGLFTGKVKSRKRLKISFLFTGQGSQYIGMGSQLYEQASVFRHGLDRCDAILKAEIGISIINVIYPQVGEMSPIDQTAYIQPVLFAIEYALYQLWQSWGIKPNVVMGYGVGEYVAATVAGIFSLEDGLKLIAHQARLIQQLPADGEMLSVLAEFAAIAAQVTYNQPRIPLISNITGTKADKDIATANYWVNHIRQPVKFAQSMETLHQAGYEIFLEIGPKPVLLDMGRQCLPEGVGVWLPSLREDASDWQQMLQSLAELYVRGVQVDWVGFDRDYPRKKVALPTYPFQRQRYWVDAPPTDYHRSNQPMYPLLGSKLELAHTDQIIYYQYINLTSYPWIGDYRVYDTAVIPGVSYVAMAFAAVGTPSAVEDINFIQPLFLTTSNTSRETQFLIHPTGSNTTKQNVEVFSRDATELGTWQKHAEITLLKTPPALPILQLDIKSLHQQLTPIDHNVLNNIYTNLSLVYGPMMQAVDQAWVGEGIYLLEIVVPETLEPWLAGEPIHPVLLDACTRLYPGALDSPVQEPEVFWVSWNVRGMILSLPAPRHFYAYVNQSCQVDVESQARTYDIHLLDEIGQSFGYIEGFTLRRTPKETLSPLFFANFSGSLAEKVESSDFLTQLAAATVSDRYELLINHLSASVAQVMEQNLSPSLDLQQSFAALGMNSLQALKLRNLLQSSLNCSLPSSLIFNYPTMTKLVNYLAKEVLVIEELPDMEQQSSYSSDLSTALDDLSENEIEKLLAQELFIASEHRS